jgi:hypothetical protein
MKATNSYQNIQVTLNSFLGLIYDKLVQNLINYSFVRQKCKLGALKQLLMEE